MLRGRPPLAPGATIAVRGKDRCTEHDAVWIAGHRAYDTWVIINGVAEYHSPPEGAAGADFARHELAGGRHAP